MKPFEYYFNDIYKYLNHYYEFLYPKISNYMPLEVDDFYSHRHAVIHLDKINSLLSKFDEFTKNNSSIRFISEDIEILQAMFSFFKNRIESNLETNKLKPKTLSSLKKELIKIYEMEKSFKEFQSFFESTSDK